MKNLFILGAGASKPYGFPTGFELRQWLIENIAMVFDQNGCLKEKNLRRDSLENFALAFRNSNTSSIDLFLSRNHQYEMIGKAGIAHKIIECESRGFEQITDPTDDWYFYFYNRLSEGMTTSAEIANIFQDYGFVTFNYDRSFEAYLSESIFFSFFSQHPSLEDIDYSKFPGVDIVHVYGSIGPYPSKQYFGRTRYLKEVGDSEIGNIKTLYAEREENTEAAARIKSAKRIFFLGFGYLPENMQKLGINKSTISEKEIYGTAFGCLDGEIHRIEKYFQGAKRVAIRNVKSIELLKNFL